MSLLMPSSAAKEQFLAAAGRSRSDIQKRGGGATIENTMAGSGGLVLFRACFASKIALFSGSPQGLKYVDL